MHPRGLLCASRAGERADLSDAEPVYLTECPENEFTAQIVEPEHGEIASDGNNVSVGTLPRKDNVMLSIAHSGEMLSVLITME